MFDQNGITRGKLLKGVLASGILISTAAGQSAGPAEPVAAAGAAAPATKQAATANAYKNQPSRIAKKAAAIYEAVWGIEAPSVKVAESGLMIRFSYRVLDPEKAQVLTDKKSEPLLICMEKGVRLTIPSFEKVGQLRQAPHELEAGKSYWMAFSNAGRPLKPGDRVDIVIGNFRAQGLELE